MTASPHITVTADPTEGGIVSGSGYYAYGKSATLAAIPNSGYRFVGWSDGVTNQVRTINSLSADETAYTAVFEKDDYVSITLPSGLTTATGSGAVSQTISGSLTFQTIILEATSGYTFGSSVDVSPLNNELSDHGLLASYDGTTGKITISQKSGKTVTAVTVPADKIPAPIKDISVNLGTLPDGLTLVTDSGSLSQTLKGDGRLTMIKIEAKDDYVPLTEADVASLKSALRGKGLDVSLTKGVLTISGRPTGNVADSDLTGQWPTMKKVQATDSSGTKYATVGEALAKVDSGTITTTGVVLTPVTGGKLKSNVTLKTKAGEFTANDAEATIRMDANGAVTLTGGKLTVDGAVKAEISGKDYSFTAASGKKYTVDTSAKPLTVPAGTTVTDGNGVKYTGEGTFTFGDNDTVGVGAGSTIASKDNGGDGSSITGVDQDTKVTVANGNVKLTGGKGQSNSNMTARIGDLGDQSFAAVDGTSYTVDTGSKKLTLNKNGSVQMGVGTGTDKVTFRGSANDSFILGKNDGDTTATIPQGASITGRNNANITGVAKGIKDGAKETKVAIGSDGALTLVEGKGTVTGEATVKVAAKDKDGNVTKTVDATIPAGKTYTIDADKVLPIVGKLGKDDTIRLGGITYTAANASTMFAMAASDADTTRVDLLDSGDSNANSALKFTDKTQHTVNDVTYQAQAVKDATTGADKTVAYTVTYGTKTEPAAGDAGGEKTANCNTVSVAEGSKVAATMNAKATINIGSGKVGEKEFTSAIPFHAGNSGASILIDNSEKGAKPNISGNGSYLTPIKDQEENVIGYEVTRYSSGGHSSGSSATTPDQKDEKTDAEIKAEQDAEAVALTGKIQLKARSVKTAKGNIKVSLKITKGADSFKALEDMGYTLKYQFYRSTEMRKNYEYKFETYKKPYTNTDAKKGVRYYYKARVLVYDAQGNLIAKTKLGKCWYATRVR